MPIRVRALVGSAVLVIAAAGAVIWFARPDAPVVIPAPESLDRADPAVVALIGQARAVVLEQPQEPEAWLRLGMVYDANMLWSPAVACYEQAAMLDPKAPRPRYQLALLWAETGRADDALALLDALAEEGIRHPALHWRRGDLLLARDRLDDARAAYTAATTPPPGDPAAWVGLARTALAEDRPADAVDILERLLVTLPANRSVAERLLGTACRRLGRHADAEAAFSRGHGRAVPWPDAWADEVSGYRRDRQWEHERALALLGARRPDAAAGMLASLHERYPDDRGIASNFAIALRSLGRLDESLAVLESARAAGGDEHRLVFNLALGHWIRARRAGATTGPDVEAARGYLDRAIAINPSYAPAVGLDGDLLAAAGRDDEALAAYRRAAGLDRSAGTWLVRGAAMLAQRGRSDEAAVLLAEALDRNPYDPLALRQLVEVDIARGDRASAAATLERLRRLSPGDPALGVIATRVEAMSDGPTPAPGPGRNDL